MQLRQSLYIDILFTALTTIIITWSLISDSYSLFPLNTQLIIGFQNVRQYFELVHYVLIALGVILIYQTMNYIRLLTISNSLHSIILNFYLFKWGFTTIINCIPYAYNYHIPIIFLLSHLIMFMFFYYQKLK